MTKLMDVTLRDGSYAINFQFSEYETGKISKGVYDAGIQYIEVGHGVGIGGSTSQNGIALCSDEEYLAATKESVPNAKYGMFCNPAFAKIDSLEMLLKYGASFVRVGSNVTEVETTRDYITVAKNMGLEVMANYMKSYVVSPRDFAENVKKSESYGADVVYIVDSAGSMSREDLYRYYEQIRNVSDIKVGFHAHNNLGLAVANSLYAIELGFDYVDSSLMGMGRSAGNASTELIIGNLLRQGHNNDYDLKMLLNCAEKYVKPLWKHRPNALDLYSGIAEFHTSYMKYIHKSSIKYQVNPLDLIVEYCKYDKTSMNEEMLDKIASGLPKDYDVVMTDLGFNDYIGNEQVN